MKCLLPKADSCDKDLWVLEAGITTDSCGCSPCKKQCQDDSSHTCLPVYGAIASGYRPPINTSLPPPEINALCEWGLAHILWARKHWRQPLHTAQLFKKKYSRLPITNWEDSMRRCRFCINLIVFKVSSITLTTPTKASMTVHTHNIGFGYEYMNRWVPALIYFKWFHFTF